MNNELFRDLESMTIGLDDTFKFHCDQCSKCCTHREDIILSPMDIFKMAKELKMTPVEFYHEYCVFNIGEHTRMPIVRLASEGKDTHCVLLKNHRCSVHKVKPAVCAMFPLGRYIGNMHFLILLLFNMNNLIMHILIFLLIYQLRYS